MKIKLLAGVVGALTMVSAPLVFPMYAFAYTSPGSPTGYVNDFAHVMSDSAKTTLEAELKTFDASTSNQITVVTVPSMDGDYIENYAVQLFKEWGIGTKNRDNGVLLLDSIGDRKIRIEVGYGLEGALPDSVAQSIISEVTPQLKSGDFDGAFATAATDIELATQNEYQATADTSSSGIDWSGGIFLILWLFLALGRGLALVLGKSKSFWLGGVVGGALGGISGAIASSAALTPILGFGVLGTLLGLAFDYYASKHYHAWKDGGGHGTPPWFMGGGSSGSSSGGSFGGFGGGSSGGGGASGSY